MPSAIVLQPLRRFVFPSSPLQRLKAKGKRVGSLSPATGQKSSNPFFGTKLAAGGLLVAGILLAGPGSAWTQDDNPSLQPQTPAKNQVQSTTTNAEPTASGADQQATLEAKQQRQVGRIYYADGDVDVHYQNTRLRADHVEYNEDTQVAIAHGHVQLDYMTQHVEAEDARYEVSSGRGTFHHVRATIAVQRRPPPVQREVNAMQRQPAQTLLVSPNPIYFEAEEAERIDPDTYRISKAWMTVCDPVQPTWKFYAPRATVYIKTSVRLENGNFRLFSVPVLYLPYATFPAEKQRASGFLIPDFGQSSSKGYIFGDAVYWAPKDWADFTLGAYYYSRRGWNQRANLRLRPWENARLDLSYNGVEDRGLRVTSTTLNNQGVPVTTTLLENQGGHEARLLFTALLPDGWRAVADLDNLSSLTYRLAFSETYIEAVNSEVRNTAFLTNNFRGFSLNVAAVSYQNYLSASPDTYVSLRAAPELRVSSVDQAPWQQLPFYFSFEAFTDAAHRSDTVTNFSTPNFVERSEFAPSVTMPFHWGPWIGVTPSFTLRSTYYGGQIQNGSFVGAGFWRETEELSVDVRPPTFDRVWGRSDSGTRWKHVIEPDIRYTYVTGVNDFSRFVRFDEDETLTDTNQVELGVTQRLYRRKKDGTTEELITWRLAEVHFFDPAFGGALIAGQRNVFQATDELTPFAFLDAPRHFSPLVSDLRIEPGKHWDTQFIVNFDPKRGQLTAIGTLLKLKPYKESFLTLSHFSAINLPTPVADNPPNFVFESRSDQVRALFGWGDLTRPGFNVTIGASYDIVQHDFQNQIAEVIYNGSCCGIGVGYRKFSFGNIRSENQYLWVFRIANLGSVGTLLRPEKIF
jgi:LPS-assembly protein